jgi:hypothetical protein
MAFALPIALALFALFIPIILLYLLKQRRRKVIVSNLLFWEKVLRDEHTITSFARLRKLLSLLLQLLIVGFLVLAISRPLFATDLLGARRIVLILDTSASMSAMENGGTRFEQAKVRAEGVIRAMGLGDNLMLIALSSDADIVSPFTNGRKDLLDALAKIEISNGDTQFKKALEIISHLPADSRETHVYLVSDGAYDPVEFTVPEKTRFAYLKAGSSTDNVGITAFQLRPLPASPRDFEIYFEAINNTKSEQRVPYEVRASGSLIDAGELQFAAGASVTRTIRQFSNTGGEVELFIDFEDAYELDNHAYGVLPEPRTIPVTLVTDGNLFLESALRTDDEIDLTTITSANFAAQSAKPAEGVTIFDRSAPAVAPAGNAIFLGTWPQDLGITDGGELNDVLISDWEKDHVVNQHISFTNISIRKARKVNLPEGFVSLITTFESPLALLRSSDSSEVLVLAFDDTSSDLPLRVAYPILVANAVRYMAGLGDDRHWETPPVGTILSAQEVRKFVSKHTAHANETMAKVLAPDEATPEAINEGETFEPMAESTLVTVRRAGIYRAVTTEGESLPLFASNVNSRRESEITPSEKLPILSTTPVPEIQGGLRLGTEPWYLLAGLAFALLTCEWWLFHRRIVE